MMYTNTEYIEKVKKPLSHRIAAIFSALLVCFMSSSDFTAMVSELIVNAENIQDDMTDSGEEGVPFVFENPDDADEETAYDVTGSQEDAFNGVGADDIAALSADNFAVSYAERPLTTVEMPLILAGSSNNEDSPSPQEAVALARQKLAQFSVNYVTIEENNKDTEKYIWRDNDFSMKYGMKISIDYPTKRGAIEVSMNPVAFMDRYGNEISVTDIGVHESNFYYQNGKFYLNGKAYDSYEAMEEDVGSDSVWNKNSASSSADTANMNYYKVLAEDGSVEKYILVNYQDETSANWNITFVYNNIDAFNVVNGTGWTFDPDITVTFDFPIQKTFTSEDTSNGNAFTGKKYTENDINYYMDSKTVGNTTTETYYKYDEASEKYVPYYSKIITKSSNSETITWKDDNGNILSGENEPILIEATQSGTITSDAESATDSSYTYPVTKAISKVEIAGADTTPDIDAFVAEKYLDTTTGTEYYLNGTTYYVYNNTSGKYETVSEVPAALSQVKSPYDNIITGLIDTTAEINRNDENTDKPGANKIPIQSNGSYGSNLYTINQMSQYMTKNVANDTASLENLGYITTTDGGTKKLNGDYIYVGWDVTTNGICTQPWTMYFNEFPGYQIWVEAANGAAVEYTASDSGVREINGKYYKPVYATIVHGYTDANGTVSSDFIVLGNLTNDSVTALTNETETGKYTQGIYTYNDTASEYEVKYYIPFENNAVSVKVPYSSSQLGQVVSIVTLKNDGSDTRIVSAQSLENTISYPDGNGGTKNLTSSNAWLIADATSDSSRSTYNLNNVNKNGTFTVRDFIIIAYKKSDLLAAGALYYTIDDDGRIVEQYDFTNSVDAVVLPVDDSAVSSSAAASGAGSTYNSYIFRAGEQGVSTYKTSGSDSDGFVTVYDTLQNGQDSLGTLTYYGRASVSSFNSTHENDGSYADGTYVHFIAADDVLTAEPRGTLSDGTRVKSTPVVLGIDDYFYNSIKITVTEEGRDTEEDHYAVPAASNAFTGLPAAGNYSRDWKVYIWKDDAAGWEYYDTIKFEDYLAASAGKSGAYGYSKTYTFDETNGPCRVKVEHDTIDYKSKVEFNLGVNIKKTSPKFNKTNGTLRPEHNNWTKAADGTAVNYSEIEYYNYDLRNYVGAAAAAMIYEENTDKFVKQLVNHTAKYGEDYLTDEHINNYVLTSNYNNGHNYGEVDDNDSTTDNHYVTPNYLIPGTGTYHSAGTNVYSSETSNTFSQNNIMRSNESLYISAVKKESEAKKYAYTVNDKINNLVNITYTLTGREGYTFDTARFAEGSTLANQLQNANYGYLTDRKYVYFYDLLPPGVLYSYDAGNPPKVGKLTSLTIDTDKDGQNSVEELNSHVSSMDGTYWEIKDEPETFRDWKGSGRMLVRFKVGLKDNLSEDETLAAQKMVYGTTDEKKWYLGLGIQFTAYVPWDRYAAAQTQDNIFAYVTDTETCGIHAGNSSASGSPVYDDLTAAQSASKTIDENAITSYGHPAKTSKLAYDLFDGVINMAEKVPFSSPSSSLRQNQTTVATAVKYNRMFANANSLGLIADSSANGIRKQVRAEDDTYASYDSKTAVIAGHKYDYRITISESGSGVLGNILIYDMLDWSNFDSGTGTDPDPDHYNSSSTNINWRGTFDELEIQEIINMYSTRLQTLTKDNGTITDATACTGDDYGIEIYYTTNKSAASPTYSSTTTDWTKISLSNLNALNETTVPKKSEINGIAVKLPDGFYLASGETLSITIKMKSPDFIAGMKYAENQATYCYTEGTKFTVNKKTVFKENTGDSTHSKSSMQTLVSLGQLRKMYVKKEIPNTEGLDADVMNSEFTFSVKQELAIVNNNEPESHLYDYAYREYELYQYDETLNASNSGDVECVSDNGKYYRRIADNIYMTDGNGHFELQNNQLAYFKFIAGVTPTGSENYTFDNFVVNEEASDTWYTDKEKEEGNFSQNSTSGKLEDITFKNYYTPNININKKTTAVPDSVSAPDTFKFKIALFEYDYYNIEDEKSDASHKAGTIKSAALIPYNKIKDTLSDDGDYKIVDKGSATVSSLDVYPLTVANGTVSLDTTQSQEAAACLALDAAANASTNMSIYIEKKEDTNTVGMLERVLTTANNSSTPEDDSEYTSYPRYGYILYEDLTSFQHWELKSMEHNGVTETNGTGSVTKPYIHPIEFNSSTLTFTNTYDLKDILLTKNVTNAPDDIENYAFVFRLKRNGGNITEDEANKIKWELCDYVNKKAVSMAEPVKGTVEYVNGECTFIVPLCGNDKNNSTVKTIRISGIPANDTSYSIEEVLKKEEQNSVIQNVTLGKIWVEAASGKPKEYDSTAGDVQVGEKYYKQVYVTTVSGYTDATKQTPCEYEVLGTYNSTTHSVTPDASSTADATHTQAVYVKDNNSYSTKYYIPLVKNNVYSAVLVEKETNYTISLDAENGTAAMTTTDYGENRTYQLAQDTMFYNSVKAGSKKITLDSSTVSMKVENDYLMRSLIVQKTVAGVADDTPFTLYIVRSDGQKSDFITNTTEYTVGNSSDFISDISKFMENGTKLPVNVVTLRYANENGGIITNDNEVQAIKLTLKANETAVFHDIDLKGTSYSLYEEYNSNFPPLFDGKDGRIYAASASATVGTIPLAGPTALRMKLLSDSPNEILNGDDDFILIGKLYTGITNVDTYKKPISLQLSIGGDGFTPIPVNLTAAQNQYTDNGTSHPIIAISSSSNTAPQITNGMIENLAYTDKVIVNLKELYDKLKDFGQTLPDRYEDVKFYATETKIDGNVISDTAPYYTFKDDVTYIVIRSEDEKQSISGDINSHNMSLMNNISTYTNEHVVYKRIAKASTTTDDVNPTTPLKFCITDTYGEPASGISYVAVYNGTQYTAGTSDENGEISISIKTGEKGWSTTDGVSSYKFALYFSKQVAIKDGAYTIKEIPNADWGTLVGYEAYGDTADKKVCKAVLAEGTQWDTRGETSDTFVNTLEKTEMEVYKHVNHPEPDSTDTNKYPNGVNDAAYIADHTAWEAEKTVISNTIFTYDIKQLIDGTAVSASPAIAYDVYNIVETDGVYTKGSTKLNTETLYTENGQFTLKDGQMAVLNVAKYAQWQITEVQQGTYKLVSDENGDIVNDEAFSQDNAANGKNAQIIGTGFKIGSDTGDIHEPPVEIIPEGLVWISSNAKANQSGQIGQVLLAVYDKSQDSENKKEDGITFTYRTSRFKTGQDKFNNMFTNNYSSDSDWKNRYSWNTNTNQLCNFDFILGAGGETGGYTYSSITTVYADSKCQTKIWNFKNGLESSYRPNATVVIPESVYYYENGIIEKQDIIGIGKNAYCGEGNPTSITVPKYVLKIGDNAFNNVSKLATIILNCENLQVIGAYAFAQTKINNITIPASVECIETGAFSNLQKVNNKRSLKLIIFETTDASKLYLPGSLGLVGDNEAPYVVFTNLTREEATTADWYGNLGGNTGRYIFKGELDAGKISDIISYADTTNLSETTKRLLYTSAGLTIPTPLPKPPAPTQQAAILPTSYSEKRREYPVSA